MVTTAETREIRQLRVLCTWNDLVDISAFSIARARSDCVEVEACNLCLQATRQDCDSVQCRIAVARVQLRSSVRVRPSQKTARSKSLIEALINQS